MTGPEMAGPEMAGPDTLPRPRTPEGRAGLAALLFWLARPAVATRV